MYITSFTLFALLCCSVYCEDYLQILVIGSNESVSRNRTFQIKSIVKSECPNKCVVHDIVNENNNRFSGTGIWTIIPAFFKYKSTYDWYLIIRDTTLVNTKVLIQLLNGYDPNKLLFAGYALRDKNPTIIHHFGFDLPEQFEYPLLDAGFILSRAVIQKIHENQNELKLPSFAIDVQHEFSVTLFKNYNITMESWPDVFCINSQSSKSHCASIQKVPPHTNKLSEFDISVMIKTFHGHHEERLPILEKTWTPGLSHISFCSDRVDQSIPTIDLEVGNTNRGHCSKTWAIMNRFVRENLQTVWLLIADDDTLISMERLLQMLGDYDSEEALIIGERYGYGFSIDGSSGYDYPTGGAGMIFSRGAVTKILEKCPKCHSPEDPDDMMIGMCALNAGIPIVHEHRLHQARSVDYAEEYIIKPISFHKFNDIDPFEVYNKLLINNVNNRDEL